MNETKTYTLSECRNMAKKIFGSDERAQEWLQSPNQELKGITPLIAINSPSGSEKVMDILGRIEYGVY